MSRFYTCTHREVHRPFSRKECDATVLRILYVDLYVYIHALAYMPIYEHIYTYTYTRRTYTNLYIRHRYKFILA